MALPKAKPIAPPPGMKGPPPGDKGGPPAGSGKPSPPKPGAEPEAGGPPPDGKPDMPPGKSAPTDAKTPAPGPGGPQPPGKGAPPPGPPPGPEPGYSENLNEAINFLKQYIGIEPSPDDLDVSMGDKILNMPDGPDPLPDKMNSLIPKGTGNQRIGTIPAPNLPTGQAMPMQRSANPGVQLVGGIPKSQALGMMMKFDESSQGGPTQSSGQAPSAPAKKPPAGMKEKGQGLKS